jgi:hypothetical protein
MVLVLGSLMAVALIRLFRHAGYRRENLVHRPPDGHIDAIACAPITRQGG